MTRTANRLRTTTTIAGNSPMNSFLDLTGYEMKKHEMYAADQSVSDVKPVKLF